MEQSVITRTVTVAPGRFAPGHLGWGHHTVQRYACARAGRSWSTASGSDHAQQARRVQAAPAAAAGAGLHQRRRALPAGHCPGLCRQLRAGPRPPGAVSACAWSHRAGAADGPAGDQLLTRHPDRLTEDERLQLKAILEQCPELRAAAEHVRCFGEMLTKLGGHELPAWIAAVRADADGLPRLGAFAAGLERDLDAVTRGLTTRWSSGPIEAG